MGKSSPLLIIHRQRRKSSALVSGVYHKEGEKENMKNFGFYILLPELNYIAPIINCFPPESVDIHIGNRFDIIKDFSSVPEHTMSKIKQFRDNGYCIKPLQPNKIYSYDGILLSAMFRRNNNRIFNWDINRLPPVVSYSHSVDIAITSDGAVSSHYIGTSLRQVTYPEFLKFTRSENPKLFQELSGLSHKKVIEYAWSGPFHIGDWAQKRFLPRNILRAELEETMGIGLPAEKPVVAFLGDEFCHPRQLKTALENLAPHVSLIIKKSNIMKIDGVWQGIEGAYEWPDADYAPNLLRFASDFILAGYNSGTLVSSVMLGLQVIPYFTSLVYKKVQSDFNSLPQKVLTGHKLYMPSSSIPSTMCHDILNYVVSPINLLDTQTILQKMSDTSWWDAYRRNLPQMQKNIFGNYTIDGAAEKATRQIIRVFGRKSFGDDIAAIRLRPEYARLITS